MDGRSVEHAVLYQILHTRKDGSAINPVVKAKMVSNFSIVVGGKQNRNSRNNIIVFPYKVVSKMSFFFFFFFWRGSCGELPVDCQFSLEGYW